MQGLASQVDSILPAECRTDPIVTRVFTGHKNAITGLCFRSNMAQLASSSADGAVTVWNMKPNQRALKLIGHKAAVTAVDFLPSGQILASSSVDRTVRLWSPTVNGDVTVFQAHTSAVRAVHFSSDGYILLTTSDDKSIKIWSTNKTKFQATLTGHSNWVRAANFSPDARLIVSGSDDKTVKLWDLRQKACVRTYTDHFGLVTSVAFHPSSTVIASASADNTIKLYDLRTHTLIQNYDEAHKSAVEQAQGTGVNSIHFGGSYAEWLISSGADGLIKIWDLREGHLYYSLHGHQNGPTTSACFSQQGDFFATAGSDNKIIMWKSHFEQKEHSIHPSEANTNHEKVIEPNIPTSEQISEIYREPNEVHCEIPSVAVPSKPSTLTTGTHYIKIPRTKSQHLSSQSTANYSKFSPQSSDRDNTSLPLKNNTKFTQENHALKEDTYKEITSALGSIAQQIDVLTQTLTILESRLTINEDRTEGINGKLDYLIQKLGNSS